MEAQALERLQCAFQTTKCASLAGRDGEITRLENFIERHLCAKEGGAMYVSGAPGTGKTACVSHVVEKQNKAIASTFYLNCTRLQRSVQVFGEIKGFLSESRLSKRRQSMRPQGAKSVKGECSYDELESTILGNSDRDMLILVLDEVDYLVEHSNRKSISQSNARSSARKGGEEVSVSFVLGSLFRLALREGSRLILLAISNNLNLLDTVMDNWQLKLEPVRQTASKTAAKDENIPNGTAKVSAKCKYVERLQFTAYSSTQIVSILRARLAEFDCAQFFDAGALVLIARRVCAESGDVRRALDCALHTAQHAALCSSSKRIRIDEEVGAAANQNGDAASGWKVTVRDANAAWVSLQNRTTTSHFVVRSAQRERDTPMDTARREQDSRRMSTPLQNGASHTDGQKPSVAVRHDINGNEVQVSNAPRQGDCADFLSDIPIQQKVILCSLVKLVDAARRNEVSIDELYSVYQQVSNATRLERLAVGEFSSACALLESVGLVSLAEAGRRGANKQRQLRIRLLSNAADLRSLLTEFDRTALLNSRILNGDSRSNKRKLSL